MPTPQQHAALAAFAVRLEAAGHGERGAILAEASTALGVSVQTVHRWLAAHRHTGRKQRSDAGQLCLSLEDAKLVSTYLNEGPRANGKQIFHTKAR